MAAPRFSTCRECHAGCTVHPSNMSRLSSAGCAPLFRPRRDDVLIVCGDVSDEMAALETALATLKSKFGHVFYVPGETVLLILNVPGEQWLHAAPQVRHVYSQVMDES